MDRNKILGLAVMAMTAYADGKVTPEELLDFSKTALKMAGVDTGEEFFDIFFEADGDLHFILKKSIVDKLKIEV